MSRFSLPAFLVLVTLACRTLPAADLDVPSAQYPKIQDAITGANDGDVIHVADGTYAEAIDFKGKKVTVQSNSGSTQAIIDVKGLNKPGVTFATNETGASILDGFTIQNAKVTTVGGGIAISNGATPTIRNCVITTNQAGKGGGIGIQGDGSGAEIDACVVTGNTVTNSAACGGGIYITLPNSAKTPVVNITDTEISKNLATGASSGAQGAGVAISGLSTKAKVTLTNCKITGNVLGTSLTPTASGGDGGGLYLDTIPTAIVGGEISDNIALNGGAFSFRNAGTTCSIGGKPTGEPLVVSGNTAMGGAGGAGYFSGTNNTATTISQLTFTNVTFQENQATGTTGGGACYVGAGHPNFQNCQFISNTTGENGGAFRMIATLAKPRLDACTFLKNKAAGKGGAIYFSSNLATTVILSNCLFAGNSATTDGGAIQVEQAGSGHVRMIYCTIANNSTAAATPASGGVRFQSTTSDLYIVDSILWGNTPQDYDSQRSTSAQINFCVVGKPVITRTASDKNLMFKDDPLFVNGATEPWDFHLQAGPPMSPAVDVGITNTTTPKISDVDLAPISGDPNGKDIDGKTRISGLLPDLGAYELPQAPVVKPVFIRGLCRDPKVAVDTGSPNIGDVLYILRWKLGGTYGAPGCIAACDVNDDNAVDLTDATYLLSYLFQGGQAPKAPFPTAAEDPTISKDMTCVKGMPSGQ